MHGRNTNLFLNFANPGLLDRFARLDVTTDDVPAIRIGAVRRAASEQQCSFLQKYGADILGILRTDS